MENKKIVAVIRESAMLDLKKELPELFENDNIIAKPLEDHMFDIFIKMSKEQAEQAESSK